MRAAVPRPWAIRTPAKNCRSNYPYVLRRSLIVGIFVGPLLYRTVFDFVANRDAVR